MIVSGNTIKMSAENIPKRDDLENSIKSDILLINAGGTIATNKKEYVFGVGTETAKMTKNAKSPISRYLQQHVKPEFSLMEELVPKDLINDIEAKNNAILEKIIQSPDNKTIIITVERSQAISTVQFLNQMGQEKKNGKKMKDKTIIITSSDTSIEENFDALFNLGYSFGAGLSMKPTLAEHTISLSDRGKLFRPDNVYYRDSDKSFFEVDSKKIQKTESEVKDMVFIVTGGTIDGRPNPIHDGQIEMERETNIEKYLQSLCLHFKWKLEKVCMKDSREIEDEDIQKVFQIIKESKEKIFLVTHGTYTMAQSARQILANIKEEYTNLKDLQKKLITFFGSMEPLKYGISDAPFNIGFAAAISTNLSKIPLPKGRVLVAMNGKVFDPRNCEKIVNPSQAIEYDELGTFKKIDPGK